MAINFSLDTSTAVSNLNVLDQTLSQVLLKFRGLDEVLKTLSADKSSRQVKVLSDTMAEMKSTSSLASKELTLQKQVTKGLQSEVKKLTQELNALGKKQDQGREKVKALADMTRDELVAKVKLTNANKRLIAEISQLDAVERRELLNAQANLAANDKRAKQSIEYNNLVNTRRRSLADLTSMQVRALEVKKAEIASNEKLRQSELRLVNGKLRESEAQTILNEQKIRAQVLAAKNNQQVLREIAVNELRLKQAIKEAELYARKELGLNTETAALNKNTVAKKKAVVANKQLNTTLSDGNLHAAEFRAGLSALGAHFGIFTGSTIIAATAVFGIVKAFKESITASAQFDFAMDRAEAVMAANVVQATQLRSTVRELAETTIFTAREVSEGLIFLGMAGQSVNEAMLTLEPTLRLAQIGMIDMKTSADLVTNIMAAFNIQAVGLAGTVDLLSTVVTNSNTSITQLAQAISFVGPAAQATQTTLRDTAVILGFFADNGVKASRAGTALRRGIANLSAPTEKIRKALLELGISTIDPLTGQMKSMVEIIRDLREEGASLQNVFDIFGKRAGPAFAAAILGDSTALEDLLKSTEDVTGATDRLIAKLEDNNISDYKKALAAGEEALIAFGNIMDGAVVAAVNILTVALKTISTVLVALETPLKALLISFTILGTVKLASIFGTMIASTLGLTAATAAAIPVASGLNAALGVTTTTAAAAAGSVGILRTAISTLFGPVGILLSLGIGLYFSTASTEAERLTKRLKPLAKSMGDLGKSTKLLSDESLGEGFEKLESRLLGALNKVEDLNKKQEETFGVGLKKNVDEARDNLSKLEGSLLLLKLDRSIIPGLGTSESELKSAQEAVDLARAILNAQELQLEAALATGKASKTENELLQARVDEQKKITRELELQAGIEARTALLKKVSDINTRGTFALQGRSGDKDEQLKRDLKLLDDQKDFLTKRLNAESNNIDSISNLLRSNFDERKQLTEDYNKAVVKDFKDAEEEIKQLLIKGKLDKINLQGALDKAAEDRGFKDYDDLFDAAKEAYQGVEDLALESAEVEQAISKKTTNIQLDNQSTRLAILKGTLDKELTILKESTNLAEAELKSSFNARLIDLGEYLSSQISLINKEADAENVVLHKKVQALKDAIAINAQTMKDAGKDSPGAYDLAATSVDNLRKELALLNIKISENGELTDIQIQKVNQLSTAYGESAVAAANKALIAQEAQLSVLSRVGDGYLTSAEANADYAIIMLESVRGSEQFTSATEQQIATLTKSRDALRDNAVQLKGLDGQWKTSGNNMAKEAVNAAKTMQSAFEDLLINPTKDGFKGLLESFGNLIREMIAKQAVLRLFNGEDPSANKGAGDGLGNTITSFFNEVLGFGKDDKEDKTGKDPSEAVAANNDITAGNNSVFAENNTMFSANNIANLVASTNMFGAADENKAAGKSLLGAGFDLLLSSLGLKTSALSTTAAATTTTSAAFALTSAAGSLTAAAGALIGAAGASSGSSLLGALASAVPAGKAKGGPVNSGVPYIVGEVGPELFVPNKSGTIVPNDKLGKSSQSNVTFNNTVIVKSNSSNTDEIKREVQQGLDKLEGKLARQQQRSQRVAGMR